MENQIDQVRLISAIVQNGVLVIVILSLYLFFAFVLAKIAEKIGMVFKSSLILALIPIANLILLLQMALKPMWWIVLLLIPYVNILFFAIVWGAIAKRRGKPGWWGVLMLIPFVNFIMMLMLAFEGKAVQQPANTH